MKKNKSRGIEHNLDIALNCAQKSVLSTSQSRVGFHSYLRVAVSGRKALLFTLQQGRFPAESFTWRRFIYSLFSYVYISIYQECVRQDEKEEQDYDNSDSVHGTRTKTHTD